MFDFGLFGEGQLESKHLITFQARIKTYPCKDSGWRICLDTFPPGGNWDVLIWGNVTLGIHSGTKGRLGSLLALSMAIWLFLISSKLVHFLPTPVNSNILILSLKDFFLVQWFGLYSFCYFQVLFFLTESWPLGVFCKMLNLLGFLGEIKGWCHSPFDKAESFICLNLDTGEEWEIHSSSFLSQIPLQFFFSL